MKAPTFHGLKGCPQVLHLDPPFWCGHGTPGAVNGFSARDVPQALCTLCEQAVKDAADPAHRTARSLEEISQTLCRLETLFREWRKP